ncbi:helix-turn-helix domain-containing protein (plasmid) [Photobacterium sp. GJ3]|uniref:GlxA family transcriptional regulator n=1 Tax=Photobacterium sp. GJ3 TaxID=2829502 RepID=UPI001B8D62DC|nr:helix-turn-helix domain-containing protein [Photobacterium sp. GJ3]QUJ70613.1 helix-turn-helix domain-containing protein [Photobacterium sp. GJ3]
MPLPTVAVVAFHRFSQFHLSVPCIIFDDILPDMKLFNLRICAGEPGPIQSSHGLTLETAHGLEGLEDADIIVIPYWRNPAEQPPAPLLAALQSAHARGAQIVGFCLGTYVLAYAGLLGEKRASTHWEFEQDFIQRFPGITLDTNSLYVEDGNMVTSAGTAAGLDCCLHLLRQRYGSAIANKVARRMVIPPHRDGGQAQFIERPVPATTQDARMNALFEFLRNHLHQAHDLDSLADRVMMTRRTFTRQFHKAAGLSVGEWLLSERLQRCQELLESTTQPMETIASQVGFPSASALRAQFKRRFNVTPSEWRKSFQYA